MEIVQQNCTSAKAWQWIWAIVITCQVLQISTAQIQHYFILLDALQIFRADEIGLNSMDWPFLDLSSYTDISKCGDLLAVVFKSILKGKCLSTLGRKILRNRYSSNHHTITQAITHTIDKKRGHKKKKD